MSFKVLQQGLFHFLEENVNALFSREILFNQFSKSYALATQLYRKIYIPVHVPKSSILFPERSAYCWVD